MLITITGNDDNFIRNALTTTTADLNVQPGATATQLTLFNTESGLTTIVTGVNMALDANEDPISGTVTGISVFSGATPLGTLSALNWPLVDIANALDALEAGNSVPLATLYNLGPTLAVDASGATDGVDMFNLFGFDLATLLTVPMTVTGSPFYDRLLGGSGNDSIVAGADNGNFNGGDIEGTSGNDTIDFSGVSDTTFQFLDYEDLVDGPVTFNVNAATNTGTITGNGFTDTLIDARRVMEADGLGLEGGEGNDVFNIRNSGNDRSWFNLRGNEGNDTFNINIANGGGRISYDFGSQNAPASGITVNLATVNLATGIVSNDGFGGQDTINILSGNGRLEIRATDNNDSLVGSNRSESFITEQGNDTVNGGGGFDRVRYDRSGVDAVNVNLVTQTATGTWDGNAFTDRLISIEEIRGSRQGNDTLTGAGAGERLDGRGGNDSIVGNNGNDTLIGGDGNDSIRGGNGNDVLQDGFGNDSLIGGAGNDLWEMGSGEDTFDGGGGFDTVLIDLSDATPQSFAVETNLLTGDSGAVGNPNLRDSLIGVEAVQLIGDFDITVTGSTEANLIETDLGDDSLIGNAGDDTLNGGAGNDTLRGGNDNDVVTGGLGNDTLFGGNGNDSLTGGDGNDSAEGGNGNDTILGGSGFDTLRGGNGDDTVNGGNGRDSVFLGGGDDLFIDNTQGGVNGRDTVLGGSGNDTINGGNGNDRFEGQDGTDLIRGRLGNDVLFGGNQNDTLEGGDGNDTVAGGNGRDRAFLGNGNDRWFDNDQSPFGDDFVQGGQGNDWIQAGGGNDTLAGGAGADTFVLAAAIDDDVITDYAVGVDALEIDAALWNGALSQGRLDALTSVQGGDLVFSFDNGDSLTLEGVTSTAGLLGDIDIV